MFRLLECGADLMKFDILLLAGVYLLSLPILGTSPLIF
jgi:hypothetical protein